MVTETTLHNFNPDLYKQITADNSVLYWARSAVACRLAVSAKGWVDIMSMYNRYVTMQLLWCVMCAIHRACTSQLTVFFSLQFPFALPFASTGYHKQWHI